jgi:hypothetical protein
MVSVTVLLWLRAPLVPVIVSVKVPVAALSPVRVRVVLPDPATVDGLKLAVMPGGTPLAVKLTLPVKPPVGVIVTMKLAELPCEMVCDEGNAEIEKSPPPPTGFTTSVPVAECTRLPLVPVIVSG